MTVQEQAAEMAYGLSDDNAVFLIDFMKKFMFPDSVRLSDDGNAGKKTGNGEEIGLSCIPFRIDSVVFCELFGDMNVNFR